MLWQLGNLIAEERVESNREDVDDDGQDLIMVEVQGHVFRFGRNVGRRKAFLRAHQMMVRCYPGLYVFPMLEELRAAQNFDEYMAVIERYNLQDS